VQFLGIPRLISVERDLEGDSKVKITRDRSKESLIEWLVPEVINFY
jgi:predicted RNA binding protein with dsRBD fold (UPF0201 family)